MAHDFENFPELTNGQMSIYYFDSPHTQIAEDFTAEVIKVTDGDTVKVRWHRRDFDFPIRFINIAAPELKESGGKESQSWLETRLLGEEIDILIDPNNRVGKWGRILGRVIHQGLDVGEESMMRGLSVAWEDRNTGEIPEIKWD